MGFQVEWVTVNEHRNDKSFGNIYIQITLNCFHKDVAKVTKILLFYVLLMYVMFSLCQLELFGDLDWGSSVLFP